MKSSEPQMKQIKMGSFASGWSPSLTPTSSHSYIFAKAVDDSLEDLQRRKFPILYLLVIED
jgi:hypothetical protein